MHVCPRKLPELYFIRWVVHDAPLTTDTVCFVGKSGLDRKMAFSRCLAHECNEDDRVGASQPPTAPWEGPEAATRHPMPTLQQVDPQPP